MSKFPERLKKLRLAGNLTQEEVAKDLETTRSIISKYERGETNPKIEMLEELAEYFGVEFEYLSDNEGEKCRSESCETKKPELNLEKEFKEMVSMVIKSVVRDVNARNLLSGDVIREIRESVSFIYYLERFLKEENHHDT